jgi:uncharacterized repeat protein (TIGR01451 family)
MKIFSSLRMFALPALGLMVAISRLEEQGLWLNVGTPSFAIGVSNNLTFYISVTNLTGVSQTIVVTNTMPAMVQFVGVSFGLVSYPYTSAGSNVIFNVGTLTNNGLAQMAVTVMPTAVGFITNTVWVATNGVAAVVGSLSVQVTNAIPVADLAVGMTGPSSQVFSNDWMVYGVTVANLGPGTAPSVFLTNTLPPGVGYKSVSPAITRIGSGSNVIFNLGTLVSGAFTNFQLTVQPTNAGTWTFVSVVSTNSVIDPNPTNNSASINVVVSNFLSNPGQLTATIVFTQKFNQLSGRLEQSIVLSNAGPTSVDSARVIVTGLTNLLSNAVGTNNSHPFVTYASTLGSNQSVYLLLQFYPNQSAFPFTNSQLQAVGVTMPDLTPAAGLIPTNVALIVKLPSGGMVLAFPSLTNRTYTVEYTSNLLSTNWLAAQPLTWTPANYTYWIDYGPPETVSHPTNTPMRFYRVFLNP